MPFSLCNTIAIFQQLMHYMLLMGIDKFITVYLEDTLIFCTILKEHVGYIRWDLTKFRENYLFSKLKKSKYSLENVQYLGQLLENGKLITDPQTLSEIKNCPTPITVKE